MGTQDSSYTTQEIVEGLPVIGFVDRGPKGPGPDATYAQDLADFRARMEALGQAGPPVFAVVDFSNYRMPAWDNGRGVVSVMVAAQRRLVAQGGGLVVCHHPAQFNPDLQNILHFDRVITIARSRREALDVVRRALKNPSTLDPGNMVDG